MNRLARSMACRVASPEPARCTQDRVAQRAAQAVEDGGAQQERLDLGGLSLQDLLDQVVQDEAVAAGEGADEAGGALAGTRASLQGDGRHLQPGDPAFGAGLERRDVLRREVQAHRPSEELGGFGGREAQVGGAQLGQLAPGAQPGQGQARVFAGGDDQMHPRRQVLEQEGDGLIDRLGVDHVVVVEDQDEVVGDRRRSR